MIEPFDFREREREREIVGVGVGVGVGVDVLTWGESRLGQMNEPTHASIRHHLRNVFVFNGEFSILVLSLLCCCPHILGLN